MTRSRLIGLAGAAIAGATLAVVLIGVAVALAGGALASTTAAAGAGWMVPVAAGLTVAWAAWRLARESESAKGGPAQSSDVPCDTCGGSVFTDWRLCPHCGAFIDSCPVQDR